MVSMCRCCAWLSLMAVMLAPYSMALPRGMALVGPQQASSRLPTAGSSSSSLCGGPASASSVASLPLAQPWFIDASSLDTSVEHDRLMGDPMPAGHRKLLGSNSGIRHHGGPVMGATAAINMYFIFYGTWDEASRTKQILTHFGSNLGCSDWYKTTHEYSDTTGRKLTQPLRLAQAVTVQADSGSSLVHTKEEAPNNIPYVILNLVNGGSLPEDWDNGIYFIFNSADIVPPEGMCTDYCGWHNFARMTSSIGAYATMKYSFVGDPTKCGGHCGNLLRATVNGDVAGDLMASTLGHEITEAVTDPELNAWWNDDDDNENADMCAWLYGDTSTSANGAASNVKVGGKPYLIQQNWSLAKKACVLSSGSSSSSAPPPPQRSPPSRRSPPVHSPLAAPPPPSSPDSPDTPASPDSPAQPDSPSMQDSPDGPSIPDGPSEPNSPSTPDAPAEPNSPNKPRPPPRAAQPPPHAAHPPPEHKQPPTHRK